MAEISLEVFVTKQRLHTPQLDEPGEHSRDLIAMFQDERFRWSTHKISFAFVLTSSRCRDQLGELVM